HDHGHGRSSEDLKAVYRTSARTRSLRTPGKSFRAKSGGDINTDVQVNTREKKNVDTEMERAPSGHCCCGGYHGHRLFTGGWGGQRAGRRIGDSAGLRDQ